MRYSLAAIPAGEAGTDATVNRMVELVKLSGLKPDLRLVALRALQNSKFTGRQRRQVAALLFDFVRRSIRFVNDPVDLESVQQPEVTLRLRAGDCDDQAVLIAALARSVGIPARFVVIGASPDAFRHVYTELLIDGSWLPVDTTARTGFGVAVPELGVRKIYSINDNGGLSMPEAVAIPVRRDQAASAVRSTAWAYLMQGWTQGLIDNQDLRDYLQAIQNGMVEFSGNTFFEPVMVETVSDFLAYVESNGIPSRKSFTVELSGLSGFFGDLWNGVKKVIKPAAVVGATIIGGAGAGAAVGSVLYSGGGAKQPTAEPVTTPAYGGGTVSVPVGKGTVTYDPNRQYQAPVVRDAGESLFTSPIFLLGAAAVLILLLKK